MRTTFSGQMNHMMRPFSRMAFLTMFLAWCSGVVSVKMNAAAGAVQGITFATDPGDDLCTAG